MPITNPRFDDPGDAPGLAAGWTVVASVASEDVAAFDVALHWPREAERFGFGHAQIGAFAQQTFAVAQLGPGAVERFDAGWTTGALWAAFEDAPFEGPDAEAWVVAAHLWGWDDAAWSPAPISGSASEDFLQASLTTWAELTDVAATFAGAPAEIFFTDWTPLEG